jgi:hypothetical protein
MLFARNLAIAAENNEDGYENNRDSHDVDGHADDEGGVCNAANEEDCINRGHHNSENSVDADADDAVDVKGYELGGGDRDDATDVPHVVEPASPSSLMMHATD